MTRKRKQFPWASYWSYPPFPKLELTNCVCLEYLRTYSSFLGKFSLNVFLTCESSSGGMESGGNKAWGFPEARRSGAVTLKRHAFGSKCVLAYAAFVFYSALFCLFIYLFFGWCFFVFVF